MVPPSFNQSGYRAFTLVELLCTVGVIVMLAALILPAVSKMRDSGLNAKSISNMRQIGLMVSIYTNDNDGTLLSSADSNQIQWYAQLKQASLLDLPNQRSLLVCPLMDRQYGSENAGTRSSFAMNGNLGPGGTLVKIQSAQRPSSTSVLFNSYYYVGKHTWKYTATGNQADNLIIPAYKNFVNVLFLDGGVRQISASDPRILGQNGGKGTETRLFWQGSYN